MTAHSDHHMIAMKKKQILRLLLLFLLTTAVALPLAAEPDSSKGCESAEARRQWAHAQAQKLVEKLKLNSDVAEKLSGDYVACLEEVWTLNHTYEPLTSEKNVNSDAAAEKVLKARFEKRRKFNQVQEKYYKKYSSYLTQRQILTLYKVERKIMEEHFRQERAKKKRDAAGNERKDAREQRAKQKKQNK